MKKLAIILILIMLFSCITFAYGENEPTFYTSGDYEYILLEDGTAEITGYHGEADVLAIPSAVDEFSVTSIGDMAFERCYSLTEITIPDSITSIGINPFSGCEKLHEIAVSPDHPTLAAIDGVLFDKTEKKLVCYPEAIVARTYEIPNDIVSIGDNAFYSSLFLTEIIIPDSVTSIGSSAFASCQLLNKITIPGSVVSIGDGAFDSCDLLNEITIPNSVTSIGNSAFYGCESLAEITIPDSVTSIGKSAFYGCESLTLIVGEGSYAAEYAEENSIPYTYPEDLSWLNS